MSISGRFFVRSPDGRMFCVEPMSGKSQRIHDLEIDAGGISVTPGGSVREEDTVITEVNGYKNITYLPAGMSPHQYIRSITEEKS